MVGGGGGGVLVEAKELEARRRGRDVGVGNGLREAVNGEVRSGHAGERIGSGHGSDT